MEAVRMKVDEINVVSEYDLSKPMCTECIAVNDANLCQDIADAHEIITGCTICRNKQGEPLIWKEAQ